MIKNNELINNILFSNVNDLVSFKLFLFIIIAFLFSVAIDVVLGELPGKIHPVVMMGNVISFFKKAGYTVMDFSSTTDKVAFYWDKKDN